MYLQYPTLSCQLSVVSRLVNLDCLLRAVFGPINLIRVVTIRLVQVVTRLVSLDCLLRVVFGPINLIRVVSRPVTLIRVVFRPVNLECQLQMPVSLQLPKMNPKTKLNTPRN